MPGTGKKEGKEKVRKEYEEGKKSMVMGSMMWKQREQKPKEIKAERDWGEEREGEKKGERAKVSDLAELIQKALGLGYSWANSMTSLLDTVSITAPAGHGSLPGPPTVHPKKSKQSEPYML